MELVLRLLASGAKKPLTASMLMQSVIGRMNLGERNARYRRGKGALFISRRVPKRLVRGACRTDSGVLALAIRANTVASSALHSLIVSLLRCHAHSEREDSHNVEHQHINTQRSHVSLWNNPDSPDDSCGDVVTMLGGVGPIYQRMRISRIALPDLDNVPNKGTDLVMPM